MPHVTLFNLRHTNIRMFITHIQWGTEDSQRSLIIATVRPTKSKLYLTKLKGSHIKGHISRLWHNTILQHTASIHATIVFGVRKFSKVSDCFTLDRIREFDGSYEKDMTLYRILEMGDETVTVKHIVSNIYRKSGVLSLTWGYKSILLRKHLYIAPLPKSHINLKKHRLYTINRPVISAVHYLAADIIVDICIYA